MTAAHVCVCGVSVTYTCAAVANQLPLSVVIVHVFVGLMALGSQGDQATYMAFLQ